MEEPISIKVQIANRSYPLKGTPEQESILQKASVLVNQRIKDMESTYAVRDHQDLLAMTALQLAAEHLGVHTLTEEKQEEIQRELNSLAALVGKFGVGS